jgi:predicted glycosyltransferase
VLVSDFNMAACLAAIFSGTPLVFVTERYDFTLCQLQDHDLAEGGFEVNTLEMARARTALHSQFKWMIQQSQLVLTDKPYVASLDQGTPVAEALSNGKAHFVGPMIRDYVQSGLDVRAELKIGDSPFIVASISGTTMFAQNKDALLAAYLDSFKTLRERNPDLKMVLLGRQDIAAQEGVICVPYYPDWMGLLREASLLISAPGWITVTEIAALKIPTLFVLPSKSEYHELEALRRLELLGFPTHLGHDQQRIVELVQGELDKDTQSPDYFVPHQLVAAPDGEGAARAASRIIELCQGSVVPLNASKAA